MPLDLELAVKLRGSQRPTILVVNKVDAPQHDDFPSDFARMGFSRTLGVSAAHGRGIDELVEAIEALLPAALGDAEPSEAPRLAFVGRPNVGKSSLVNTILHEARYREPYSEQLEMPSILPASEMAGASSFATPRGFVIAQAQRIGRGL